MIYYRTPEEVADKEFVKAMYTDELEILDAAIAKLPQEFYDRFYHCKINTILPRNSQETAIVKGLLLPNLVEKSGLLLEKKLWLSVIKKMTVSMLGSAHSSVVMENGNPELKKIW